MSISNLVKLQFTSRGTLVVKCSLAVAYSKTLFLQTTEV